MLVLIVLRYGVHVCVWGDSLQNDVNSCDDISIFFLLSFGQTELTVKEKFTQHPVIGIPEKKP